MDQEISIKKGWGLACKRSVINLIGNYFSKAKSYGIGLRLIDQVHGAQSTGVSHFIKPPCYILKNFEINLI
jgi:hypothetical protein